MAQEQHRLVGAEASREPVHRQIQAMALARPDGVAVTDGARHLSYGVLEAQANSLAHRLRALGVGPGSRVGLCHERSAITVVGALAILKAGGAYVGLDPTYPAARLEYMLRDAAPPVLLTQASVITRLGPLEAEVIDLDQVEVDGRSDQLSDETTTDDHAYVIYTSGSTGEPKGVVVSHRNLLSLVDWHRAAFSVDVTDRASLIASPAFDASVWEIWPYLTSGASVHIPPREVVGSPDALRDWLVTTGITLAFAPTPLAEALLQGAWPQEVPLRALLTGGDRLNRPPRPGIPFELINNYGVTEATVVSTSGTVRPCAKPVGLPTIGAPIAGTVLHVLDPEGRPVESGWPGELHIGGAGVAVGYLGCPAMTAECFLPDPFSAEPGARMYRTGDLVRQMPDDTVDYLGRLDDQVQIRGQRVELEEITAVLGAHPDVRSCLVVASEEKAGDVRLVAYFVPSHDDVPARDVLREHLITFLPVHMVPTAFIALEALPLSGSGKIDRNALPTLGRQVIDLTLPDATPLQIAVRTILEDLLELDGIGVDHNFFELGGHSLMAAQLVLRLLERFGVELSLLAIFDNPTAAGIAAEIERAGELATVAQGDPILSSAETVP